MDLLEKKPNWIDGKNFRTSYILSNKLLIFHRKTGICLIAFSDAQLIIHIKTLNIKIKATKSVS